MRTEAEWVIWDGVENKQYLDIGEIDLPPTGIGFRRDGPPGEAEEEFAGRTPDNVGYGAVSLFFGFIFGETPTRVGGGYAEGDAQSRFEVPEGPASGSVYGALSPAGSSGIATDRGLSGETEVEYRHLHLEAGVSLLDTGRSGTAEAQRPPNSFLNLGVWTRFDRVDRDYAGASAYSGAGGGFIFEFSQDRQQEVDENYFSAGLDAQLTVLLGRNVAARLTGRAGAYYRDGELESVERNRCNFCPAADQDWTLEIRDSNDGWGFRADAGAALEFRLSRRVSLTVRGAVDYWSDVGAIFNPNSGDQVFFDGLTTALRTADMWSWRAGAGLVIRFGGQ